MVKHASVGPDLSRAEWESGTTHVVADIPSGQILSSDGNFIVGIDPTGMPRYANIEFTFGDGLTTIDINEPEQWVEVPFNCSITSVRLTADVVGNFQVDIWKDSFANYPPVDTDSITASAPPSLVNAAKSESMLTGWIIAIARGDWLKVHVDSSSTVKRVVLSIGVITG
jgi:hypothetical protein